MNERNPITRLILAAMLILMVLPVAYIAGYLWLGQRRVMTTPSDTAPYGIECAFQSEWQVMLFKPAGRVESWLRRIDVVISDRGRDK